MTISNWIILYVVTFFASILRGAIGMGFALMVLPFYLILGEGLVPVPVILIGLLLSILVVVRDRKALDLSGLKYSLSGRFIGNIVAVLFIVKLSGKAFDLTIAVMVLIAVFISLLPFRFTLTPRKLFAGGFGSGVMGTISSLDGPPIALLYQHEKGEVIRATLAGYFIVGSILTLITLGFAGRVSLSDFYYFAIFSPSAIIGFVLSKKVIRFLNEKAIRAGILFVSSISAIGILVKVFS